MTETRPWLQSYPAGVPADIDPGCYESLVEIIDTAFEQHHSATGYVCMGSTLTYAEVDQLSRRVAAWLQSLSLPSGSRIAIMLPNLLQYPVLIAAVLRAGMTVVNINPQYTARELEYQLNDAGVNVIFILENFAVTLQKIIGNTQVRHVVVTAVPDLMSDYAGLKRLAINALLRHVKKVVPAWSLPTALSWADMIGQARRLPFRQCAPAHTDIAFIQYTGGTTGVAKGAMLTHANLVANVVQCEVWLAVGMKNKPGEADRQMVFLNALPLYHIFALTVCGLMGMRLGVLNVLIPNPRDIGSLLKAMRKHPVNVLPAVNTLFNGMLAHPDFAAMDHSSLRLCLGGGMAVQEAVAKRWKDVTGATLIEGYGLSETSPVVTANPCDAQAYTGSIGVPVPSTRVRIIDDQDRDCPPGERGELAIAGPQVMAGYWNRPGETAQAFTSDGYFKAGDIATLDEHGFIRIVDRKKDMILVSGFNVYPNEVEAVAAALDGVRECACIGVQSERTGEAVKLYVVRSSTSLSEDTIRAHCAEYLTAYKRPHLIVFVDQLPKTNVGKILRRALREQAETADSEPVRARTALPDEQAQPH